MEYGWYIFANDHFYLEPSEDLYKWNVVIKGRDGTPYEGGFFNLNLEFPEDGYPFKPPKINFKTKIYCSHVNENG